MEQRFVAVTEPAPRLMVLEAEKARVFLREFNSYENRVEGHGVVVPMRMCLEKDDLDYLIEMTDGLIQVGPRVVAAVPPVPPVVGGEGQVAVGLGAAMDAEANAASDSATGSDSDSNSSLTTVIEGANRLVRWLSNEHITLMLVMELGPEDSLESAQVLEAVKMKRDEVPFGTMSNAMNYLREWRLALVWCTRFLPKEKYLVKKFVR